ncbi:archaemetzincin family Zn-dependent metalloprotease [Candidatus Zixiibacteriota bacterium]
MKIYLIPLKFEDDELLRELSEVIQKLLSLEVSIYPNKMSLYGGYDPFRNQYNSSWILNQLKKSAPNGADKLLGITEFDLFIPIFTFVFGEAEFNGHTAVISSHRFQNELYGLPPDREIMTTRLIKESIHELGHTLGVRHCRNTQCVMYPSSYAEDIDFKPAFFCEKCHAKIYNKSIY